MLVNLGIKPRPI